MGFIHNIAKTKHFESCDGYLHLTTPTIQDGCQRVMQRAWQPSWILGSPSANRVITLRRHEFVSFAVKFGYCTPKTGETVAITVQLLNYNTGTF